MGIAHADYVYSRRVPRRLPSSCDNLSLSYSKLFPVSLPSAVLPPPLLSSLPPLLLSLLIAPPPAVCPLGRRRRPDINLVLNVYNLYSLGKKNLNWEIVVRYIPFKVLYPQCSTNITSTQSGTRAIHLLRSQ